MTIPDLKVRSKAVLERIPADAIILVLLILTATISFGLGILAGKDLGASVGGDRLWIEQLPQEARVPNGGGPAAVSEALEVKSLPTTGTYVASKSGTKYYLPSCGSSKRIKEENRVWFKTKEEAEAAGYAPAANCPGL